MSDENNENDNSELERVKFLEVELTEAYDILDSCIHSEKEINLWAMGEDLIKGKIAKLSLREKESERDGEKIIRLKLLIHAPEVDELYLRDKICINATVKGVEFCMVGKVTSLEERGHFVLSIGQEVYRAEKRLSERLLAFPHHQIYSYFNFLENFTNREDHSNVLSISRYKEENKKIFEKFKRARIKEELKGAKELEDIDVDSLIGFRALDLSFNGISFLANIDEIDFFNDEKAVYDFVLLVNNIAYKIKNGKIVYKVDYLSPRAGNVSMYKIGLQFDDNLKLKENLKTLIENYEDSAQVKKEFEDFLNNNS